MKRAMTVIALAGFAAVTAGPAAATAVDPGYVVATAEGVAKARTTSEPVALVVDRNATQHLLTTDRSSDTTTRIVYLTRGVNASSWTEHRVAGVRRTSPVQQIGVDAVLSDDGSRVFAVFYECDGVFVSDAPIDATRLPVPSLAVPYADEHACTDTGDGRTDLATTTPSGRAVAIGNDRVGVMALDRSDNTYHVYSGVPGLPFTAGPELPREKDFLPDQLTRQSKTGLIIAVGTGQINEVDDNESVLWSTTYDPKRRSWSVLWLVATLNDPVRNFALTNLVSGSFHTWVGVEKPNGVGGFVAGDGSGWYQPELVTRMKPGDHDLRIGRAAAVRRVHAVWTRPDRGILHSSLQDGRWISPRRLTHDPDDAATAVGFNWGVRIVVLATRS